MKKNLTENINKVHNKNNQNRETFNTKILSKSRQNKDSVKLEAINKAKRLETRTYGS